MTKLFARLRFAILLLLSVSILISGSRATALVGETSVADGAEMTRDALASNENELYSHHGPVTATLPFFGAPYLKPSDRPLIGYGANCNEALHNLRNKCIRVFCDYTTSLLSEKYKTKLPRFFFCSQMQPVELVQAAAAEPCSIGFICSAEQTESAPAGASYQNTYRLTKGTHSKIPFPSRFTSSTKPGPQVARDLP